MNSLSDDLLKVRFNALLKLVLMPCWNVSTMIEVVNNFNDH